LFELHQAKEKRMTERQATITCPACGHSAVEIMPANACQNIYECKGCSVELRPKKGDCCVFCSYGSVPCPAIQLAWAQPTGQPQGRQD
jgi:hypothetical protein